MNKLLTYTLAALSTIALPGTVAAESNTPPAVALTYTVECGDGQYSVHFTATVTNPTGETWTITPLFGAGFGPIPDTQPFTHTVGPMTDQPSSLGTFRFYLNRPDDPYNPAGWTWLSVPAPGCNTPDEPEPVEPPTVSVPVDDPPAPLEPAPAVEAAQPIVAPVVTFWLTPAELFLGDLGACR